MLLVTESAPSNRRGYYGAYAQAGAPVGVILANIAFISVSMLHQKRTSCHGVGEFLFL